MRSAESTRPPCAPRSNPWLLFLVGALGALALLAETAALTGLLRPAPPPPPAAAGPGLEPIWRRFRVSEAPGRLLFQPAAAARLPEGATVIGVSVGGRHRAYLLSALAEGPAHHVVNDLVGGRPLSVAYCDIHDCVQVVTGEGGSPLNVRVAGMDGQGMFLAAGGQGYRQGTLEPLEAGAPAFPYRRHPWERTTWGAWRRAHPDTDVFLGREAGPAEAPPPATGASS
jgi:hypothetical protein